jgi:hypothetical protein
LQEEVRSADSAESCKRVVTRKWQSREHHQEEDKDEDDVMREEDDVGAVA